MAQPGSVRRSVAAVRRNHALLRVESAYGLFCLYEMGLWVAVLLWAYDVGGTAFAGAASLVMLVPAAVLAPVGGVIADRRRRDACLRAGYLVQTVSMALLVALLGADAAQAAVVAAGTLWCVLVSWTRPAHYAAAAELSRTPADAAAANSLSGTLQSAGYFVGPVLAGLGASLGGPVVAAALFTVLGATATLLLAGVRLGEPAGRVAEGPARTTSGLVTELVRRPAVAVVLAVVGLEFLAEGCLQLLAIAFVDQHLAEGSVAAGLLIGAQGLGGILGAVAAVVLVRWPRLTAAVAGSLVACSVPMLVMPGIDGLLPALVVLVLVGAAMAFFGVAGITLLQRAVADSLIARILALRETAFIAGFAVGAVLAPLLVRRFGSAGAYAALGVALTLVAVAALPAVRRLDDSSTYRPSVLELLRGIGFLSVLDAPAIERLAHGAVELTLGPGHDVVRQGEPGHSYYLVEEGDLLVTVAGRADTTSVGPGDGFGEIALLRRVPRTATVRTLTPCRLWRIDRATFLATVAGSAGHDIAERQIDARLRH